MVYSAPQFFLHFCDPMRPFGVPQMIYQGKGCIQKIPEVLKGEGWKKVMLIIDPNMLKTDIDKLFKNILSESEVEYCIFSEIKPNPQETDIKEIGIPMFKESQAEALIAVGGGSALDSAKGIAIGADAKRPLKELAGYLREVGPHTSLPHKVYPIIAVPTTAGTGSEVIRNAVITDREGYKQVLMHDSILSKYAFCDPTLLATLPPRVAAASGMDALTQAIEAYVSRASNDFAETMSLRAIELIGPHIVPFYHNRAILGHADAMSKGCVYQGIAWNNSYPAQIHGCNHPITELLNVSHGEACAILLPAFVEWNEVVCKEKFHKVYNLMFSDHPVSTKEFESKMLVEKLIQLNRQLNILNGKSLTDLGCTEKTIDEIIERQYAKRENFLNASTNPRTTTKEQLKALLMRVMNGEYL